MLKTNTDCIARPALPLIVFGVLKGYINNPFGFMLGTFLSLPKQIKRVKLDLPKEFIKSNMFIVHLYHRLQKILPKETAFEITRAAILCSAFSVMQANFRNAEAPRTFENLVKYQQRAKEEGATKLNKMKIISLNKNRYEYRVTRCMFFEFFTHLGAPELTKIMCAADNAIFNSYLPDEIVFHRRVGQTIADGAPECEFCIERTR
jgi:hypothetical protein